MIKNLHYLKDPKLWEFWYIFLFMGNAGFISSTVCSLNLKPIKGTGMLWSPFT